MKQKEIARECVCVCIREMENRERECWEMNRHNRRKTKKMTFKHADWQT